MEPEESFFGTGIERGEGFEFGSRLKGRQIQIGIGVFAHNEELKINRTLESLRGQTLIASAAESGCAVSVWILANGCTDGTVGRAREACDRFFNGHPGVRATVCVMERPGKSNAWNEFVHRISPCQLDYVAFMDGDIEFYGNETLGRLVECLEGSPVAVVSVDTILKDLVFKKAPTRLEAISIASSEMSRVGHPKIAGSLYVLRGTVAREIWLPNGLLVEDGFLKAILLTSGFTQPEDRRRIVRAPAAAHTFEAETNLFRLLRHEVRLTKGTVQNIVIFGELRRRIAAGAAPFLGDIIQSLNSNDPHWVVRLTARELSLRGWRLLPLRMVFQPFTQVRCASGGARLLWFFVSVIRSVFNGVALMVAWFEMKRGRFSW